MHTAEQEQNGEAKDVEETEYRGAKQRTDVRTTNKPTSLKTEQSQLMSTINQQVPQRFEQSACVETAATACCTKSLAHLDVLWQAGSYDELSVDASYLVCLFWAMSLSTAQSSGQSKRNQTVRLKSLHLSCSWRGGVVHGTQSWQFSYCEWLV